MKMDFFTEEHKIRNLPTGDIFSLKSYHFVSKKSGPKIYLQANLHGPEVFGTFLLGRIIQKMKIENPDFIGELVIVPVANNMGVNTPLYNSIGGRWNNENGVNWNRIFEVNKNFQGQEEKKEFYETLNAKDNKSIEEKLAVVLHEISEGADYVVDIHTTGFKSVNHLFTFEGMSEVFYHLDSEFHIIQKGSYFGCCFDESHVLPFLNNPEKNTQKPPFACTWEVFNHSFIEEVEIEKQAQNLWNWLKFAWGKSPNLNPQEKVLKLDEMEADHLFAPIGGYFVWKKNPRDFIKKGEVYAEFYNPKTNEFEEVKAGFDFYLIGIYGASAVAEGASIAWIGKV